jgi:hypothetical protein
MDDQQDDQTVEHAPASPDVTVSGGGGPSPAPYRGMSPLKAGLLYGGAASTVMGPIGLLVGVGAGIVAKNMRDNYLDHQARAMREFTAERQGLNEEIDAQKRISDPDTARLLDHAKLMGANGWFRLQQGDQSGLDLIQQGQNLVQGVMQANITNRNNELVANHAAVRGLVSTSANDYRSQFQQNVEQATNIDQQAQRVLKLVSEPDFDPDKPFNKAILADLLTFGVNGMYKDAPSVIDAVQQGVGGSLSHIPVVGGVAADIAGGIATFMKSKDFQVSKEDYNRIAINLKSFNAQYTQQKMGQLAGQADALTMIGQKQGVLPGDLSLRDYVTGNVKELNFLPPPVMPKLDMPGAKPTSAPQAGYRGPNFIAQPFRPATLPGQQEASSPWNMDPQTMQFLSGHRPPRPTN